VDLGGPDASTAPDRLLCRRPFPPALQRWALQCRLASPGFNSLAIRFLNATEAAVPKGKAIHAIVDNYATHKHPKVKEWLARHPRWTFHFTPTSGSWLNAVEGFFAKLTKRCLKRGVFGSVVELQAPINRFLAETNTAPQPFRRTKDPHKILAAVKRGHQVLDSIQ